MTAPALAHATRFTEAARFYTEGRPSYPRLLSRRVADLVGLDHRHAVLDVGTGPGYLAIDFARHAGRVVGLEPAAEMLVAARSNIDRAGVAVELVQGTSEDLGPRFGTIRLATFGRSFHWTDRIATLAALDAIIEPGGAVALIADGFPAVPDNDWHAPFEAVRASYGGDDSGARALRRTPSHETLLLASAFSHLERVAVWERRRTPFQHFLNRALSFSTIWRAGPSVDVEEVFGRFRAALAPFVGDDGAISEVIEGQALVARRPADLG